MDDLQNKQFIFTENVLKLLIFMKEKGIKVTFGEAFRPFEVHLMYLYGYTIEEGDDNIFLVPHKKRAFTKTSKHLKRLAIDFNFFILKNDNSYELTYDYDTLKCVGIYWESLNKNNRWGGFWEKRPEVSHFQMSY